MSKFSTHLSLVCLTVITAFSLAWCVISVTPRFLICRVPKFSNGEWVVRDVHCLKVGADVRNGEQAEPEPTATEYVQPTETDIPWEPWSTPTRNVMPEWITRTPTIGAYP